MEPEEGIERLQDALKICQCYQDTYHDRRSHLAQYFKERPVVEWDFQPGLVFARLERLMEQMCLIEVRVRYLHLGCMLGDTGSL